VSCFPFRAVGRRKTVSHGREFLHVQTSRMNGLGPLWSGSPFLFVLLARLWAVLFSRLNSLSMSCFDARQSDFYKLKKLFLRLNDIWFSLPLIF
jgi:hypothetical protein